MEGITSNISIKTNNRVTEITIKNQDIQEINKDFSNSKINNHIINKPKAIMKGKTNHKFPKLKTSNDSIPKKYEVLTTNKPIKK